MQRLTLDIVQFKSMLHDFQCILDTFNLEQLWNEAKSMDPTFPVSTAREGWRGGMQEENHGSEEEWKVSLLETGTAVVTHFSREISWRFQNLNKFKWVELVHPAKFDERRIASCQEQRALIESLKELYPFAVNDTVAVEHNLNVLYNCTEISVLLNKFVCERSEIAAKRRKKDRDSTLCETKFDYRNEGQVGAVNDMNTNTLNSRSASIQDLLTIIKKVELQEALPHVVHLLELAVVTPITSVHCERVFSRMKKVIASDRSHMLQSRKNHLVLLQVEHRLLRSISSKPEFYENVVSRFKMCNRRRMDRFSRK